MDRKSYLRPILYQEILNQPLAEELEGYCNILLKNDQLSASLLQPI